ncbi:MAG: hypothetical protein ABIH57_00345, partial [Candidatus Omnitrophota bacterium]
MPSLISVMFATASVAALIVGSVIYFLGKKKTQNAIWFVYNILFSLWSFCIYEALFSIDTSLAIYWFRTSLSALIFMMPVFLHFLSFYSDREIFKKQVLGKLYITSFLFFVAGFIMPNEFVSGIASGIHLERTIIPGFGFGVISLVFVLFTIIGFYYLLHTSKLYLRFKRNQRMWLFLAMFLSVTAPFSFILATFKIITFPFGLFFVVPYLALGAYTLLKYNVAEMDIVKNKTVVFAYFSVSTLLIYAGILYVLNKV